MLFKNFDPEVKQKASIYVPAIGKVTIVVLLRNLLVSQVNLQDQRNSADSNSELCRTEKTPKGIRRRR